MPAFKMEGMEEFQKKLKLLEVATRQAMESAAERGGQSIAERAANLVTELGHVITGNLRDSLHAEAKWINPNIIEVNVGTNVFYAPYVEALPDGGYLYKATREKIDKVYEYIFAEWEKLLGGGDKK